MRLAGRRGVRLAGRGGSQAGATRRPALPAGDRGRWRAGARGCQAMAAGRLTQRMAGGPARASAVGGCWRAGLAGRPEKLTTQLPCYFHIIFIYAVLFILVYVKVLFMLVIYVCKYVFVLKFDSLPCHSNITLQIIVMVHLL